MLIKLFDLILLVYLNLIVNRGPLISDLLTWKIASGVNCLAILSLCLAHAMS